MKSTLAFVLAAMVQSTGAVKISAEEISTVKAALAARLNAMSDAEASAITNLAVSKGESFSSNTCNGVDCPSGICINGGCKGKAGGDGGGGQDCCAKLSNVFGVGSDSCIQNNG